MTRLARRIDTDIYAARQNKTRYAPFSSGAEDTSERADDQALLSGFAVLVVLLLVSGMTVALARGGFGSVESYGASAEGILSSVWVVQGAAALLCFVLAVQWFRS